MASWGLGFGQVRPSRDKPGLSGEQWPHRVLPFRLQRSVVGLNPPQAEAVTYDSRSVTNGCCLGATEGHNRPDI
jgi:hypothetical protein